MGIKISDLPLLDEVPASSDVLPIVDISASATKRFAFSNIKPVDLNIASQAQGDILYFDGTNWVRLAKGTASQLLRQNSGLTAPEWATVTAGNKGVYVAPNTDPSTLPYSETLTGSASDTLGTFQTIFLRTGVTDASIGSAVLNSPQFAIWKIWDENPVFVISALISISIAGDGDIWFGIGMTAAYPSTEKHAGFIIKCTGGVATIFATTSDGTTRSETTTSATTALNENHIYSLVMTSGTNIKFYVDNVLKVTKTTNLPAGEGGALNIIGFGIRRVNTTDFAFQVHPPSVMWDAD